MKQDLERIEGLLTALIDKLGYEVKKEEKTIKEPSTECPGATDYRYVTNYTLIEKEYKQ